jgi:hypothetical protein
MQLWREQGWKDKHKILMGDRKDVPGDYSTMLASSKFCLVLPGVFSGAPAAAGRSSINMSKCRP